MDDEYDVIVLGTGMKDTLLSGLMSVAGKKVLHMDRNGYYGGESASLNLNQMFEKYANGTTPPPELGSSRDYNIDLIPKFMMASGASRRRPPREPPSSWARAAAHGQRGVLPVARGPVLVCSRRVGLDAFPRARDPCRSCRERSSPRRRAAAPHRARSDRAGKLVKMLLYSKTTHYLEFKQIDGSYVFKKGSVYKVPVTETEALSSGLMGLFEKRRFRNFLIYVQEYDHANPGTYKNRDLTRMTSAELIKDFGLVDETVDFIGHAIALYSDDGYLTKPALDLVRRCKLYSTSLAQYGKSPYIYPLYGLGELPQAFSRLSAVHGGVYMLNKVVDKLEYDEHGRVCGVTSEGATAKCKMVIGDPSYFLQDGKVKQTGQVIRMVCIMSNPVPNTNNADSCQIIIPQSQIGRKNDIYITCLGSSNSVAPAGKYVVIVSSTVETAEPVKELAPALKLLGKPDKIFALLNNIYEPINDFAKDGCFITPSFDATSHFESSVNDVLAVYEKIMSTLPEAERKVRASGGARELRGARSARARRVRPD
jgi:Rab GDP dissociation inhibitor